MPVTWLVAANDSYFSPDLSKQLADAFRSGGDKVDFRVLPASGSEGHWLAETEAGVEARGAGAGARAEAGCAEAGQRSDDAPATDPWPDDDVILYDGVCVFCSRWIRFVAARDAAQRFRFTAIQSAYGTRLAQAFGIDPDDPDTNAVIHGGVAYFKSDARADGAVESAGLGMGARACAPCQSRCAMPSTISSRGTATGFSGSMRRALCRMRR